MGSLSLLPVYPVCKLRIVFKGCCLTRRPLVPSQLPVASLILLLFFFCYVMLLNRIQSEQRNKLLFCRCLSYHVKKSHWCDPRLRCSYHSIILCTRIKSDPTALSTRPSELLTLQSFLAPNGYCKLGVSVKSVRLVAGRLGFYSRSGHTKDLRNSIRSFCARRSAQPEVRRVECMRVVRLVCPRTAFNHL